MSYLFGDSLNRKTDIQICLNLKISFQIMSMGQTLKNRPKYSILQSRDSPSGSQPWLHMQYSWKILKSANVRTIPQTNRIILLGMCNF